MSKGDTREAPVVQWTDETVLKPRAQATKPPRTTGNVPSHVAAIGVGLVTCAALLSAGTVLEWVTGLSGSAQLGAIGLSVIGASWIARSLRGPLFRRLRASQWTPFDTVVLSVASTAGMLSQSALLGVGAALGWGILRGRLRRSFPPPQKPTRGWKFRQMEALPSLGSDLLNRRGISAALRLAIAGDRDGSLVIGLNGEWGVGKTTIMNDVGAELASSGVEVVRFDAWNYREPSRLVEAYLGKLRAKVDEAAPSSGIADQIATIGQALAAVKVPGVGTVLGALSGAGTDVSDSREELAEKIARLPTRIVVFLDDLDRVDRDELQAVLRLVRLLGESHVTHVLAYDRSQLARTLFPDDPEGTRAREYLAKVVHVEFNVPVPEVEAALRMLDECLAPVFEHLVEDVTDEFARRLRDTPATAVMRCLNTPREINRVAQATAFAWARMSRDLNLYDLFLVTLLQYRFPHIYRRMQVQPAWFTRLKWADDFRLHIAKEAIEKERDAYFESVREDLEGGGPNVHAVLVALLPGVADDEHGALDERAARRSRRLVHPDVLPRYFQSALSPTGIREASMEDLGGLLMEASEGVERRGLLAVRVLEEVEEGRIRSFFDQFHLIYSMLAADETQHALRDVVIGLSQVAHEVPGSRADWLSPSASLQAWVRTLVGDLRSSEAATELVREVVETSPSWDLVEGLVFYSYWAPEQRRHDAWGEHPPDGEKIRSALDGRLAKAREEGALEICGCDDDLLVAVLYRASPETTQTLLAEDVPACPDTALKILTWSVRLDVWSEEPFDYSVTHNGLDGLEVHVGLDLIRQLVACAESGKLDAHGQAVAKVTKDWVYRRYRKIAGEIIEKVGPEAVQSYLDAQASPDASADGAADD